MLVFSGIDWSCNRWMGSHPMFILVILLSTFQEHNRVMAIRAPFFFIPVSSILFIAMLTALLGGF